MPKLLYLVHRIPYPANKGDKIRSFNFLQALAQKYEIYLGCFIDDPDDQQYIEDLNRFCVESHCITLQAKTQKLFSLRGLLSGEALSLPFYRHKKMQAWVDKTIQEHQISRVLIFSSPMAQYVEKYQALHLVADFVDVDSDKWLQYAEKSQWPFSWIYQRESLKLLKFERHIAKLFNATILVSEHEAQHLQNLAPDAADKIGFVNNGVDTQIFNPLLTFESPFATDEQTIVFTGAMDYWANVDAVQWFALQVLPLIKLKTPNIRFYIVGSKPTKTVLALAEKDSSVIVTGRVEEIRSYMAYADVIVAPLRIARGIQNKVLEGMSMAKALVATSMAMEGIPGKPGLDVLIADEPEQFASAVMAVLQRTPVFAQCNRDYVQLDFSWEQTGQLLSDLLERQVTDAKSC
jgi:sugar transferase (PEP-CTERM/EpsH1 system associated)